MDTHPKREAQAQPAEATTVDEVAKEEDAEAQLASPSPMLAGHAMDAEMTVLLELASKKEAAQARTAVRKEQEQHACTVAFTTNKTDDEYKLSFSRWDPLHIIPADAYPTICLNVKQSGEYLKGAAVDLASPIDIQNDLEQAQLTCKPN
eukprot:3215-Rhodomonas_salina.2